MLRTFKGYYVEILLFLSNLKSSLSYAQVTSGGAAGGSVMCLPLGTVRHLGERSGSELFNCYLWNRHHMHVLLMQTQWIIIFK